MDKIRKAALINTLATALYITGVSTFMMWASAIKIDKGNSFLGPIAFLMLFVTSAGICGYLVFGKPALMYIDGKKKEAVSLLTQTFIFLFAFTVVAIILLLVLPK